MILWFLIEEHTLRRRGRTIEGKDTVMLPLDNSSSGKAGYLSVIVLPFVLHLGFMSATAFFVMHVQVRLALYNLLCHVFFFGNTLLIIIWPWCALRSSFLLSFTLLTIGALVTLVKFVYFCSHLLFIDSQLLMSISLWAICSVQLISFEVGKWV